MSTLSTKADALRVLAAKLDRIDREIETLLGDTPTVVMSVELPPIKTFEIIRPLIAEPKPLPITATEILARRAAASAPVVPPLAFGQVIFYRDDGALSPQPRFITRKNGTAVRLIDADGETVNTYSSLEALAAAVSIQHGDKMYSVNK